MLDNLIIIKVKVLQSLQAKARLWGLGWLLGLIAVISNGYLAYRITLTERAVAAITQGQAELTKLQSAQALALVNGWSEHKVAVERLTEWADFVSVRQSLIQYNQSTKVSTNTRREALGN